WSQYHIQWSQYHIQWSRNYQNFYEILQANYKYDVFADIILKHRTHVNKIMRQDGFCAGFRYNLMVRNNTFQCNMFRHDTKVFPNISILWVKEVQEAYSVARANDKLKYPDNPYSSGRPREDWDPPTYGQ
ncbi:hypothetical protein VP01_5163g2, partial [Puccinia sorghi]